MIAKGRDASDLFPAVVKNVVSKNIEVKKLVYVYLVRYAEEQQDLALLSISTFQRALKVALLFFLILPKALNYQIFFYITRIQISL
jgi:hypothetical protein